jgi:hypothetical protein
MDQGLAIVIAASISFVGGTLLGGMIEARRSDHRAKADRVRDERLRAIEETEIVVATQLRAMHDILSSRSGLMTRWRAWMLRQAIDRNSRADLMLIGDIEALAAMSEAYLRILRKFPVGPFRNAWLGIVLLVRRPWSDDDLESLDAARSLCLGALRLQRERALRDEKLVTFDPKELGARVDIAGLAAATDRLRGKPAVAIGPE